MRKDELDDDLNTPARGSLDEKIVKKKSIPAQIAFWVVVMVLLYAFYKAFSGHGGH